MNEYTNEMKRTNRKISEIINNDFDTRMEVALFSYMFDEGIDFLKQLTDDQINSEIEDNGFMSKEFQIALVKTARRLATEFNTIELMTYIRMELWMTPSITKTTAWKNYDGNFEIENDRYLDLDEDADSISIYIVVEED